MDKDNPDFVPSVFLYGQVCQACGKAEEAGQTELSNCS